MIVALGMLSLFSASAAPRGVESGLDAPDGLERAYASRRVALVVGIDTYKDPALGDLQYAAKDAIDVATVLRDPALGGYDVVSLLSGSVTQKAFWDAFSALASTVQRDDTVLVYVASHGTLSLGPGGTELYLLGTDAWLSSASETGIEVRALSEAVSSLPSRRTVTVIDACYSGTGRSALDPEVSRRLQNLRGPIPAPRALTVSEFSAHLYAAHIHQPSLEDDTLENGVYTHFFVEALRGEGDRDGDGLVEVMEAHDYARDKVLSFTGGSQVPWAETVSVGREVLYLAGDPSLRRSAEDALLVGLESLPIGSSILVDGNPRGGGPIAEGVRHLSVSAGEQTLLDRKVRVRPGDRIDLSHALSQRPMAVTSLGVLASPDQRLLGPAGLSLSAGLAPPRLGSRSLEVGLSATALAGPTRGAERFPAGTIAARGLLVWSAGQTLVLSVGPSLSAGFAWRLPSEPGPEASPLLQPGLVARAGRALFAEVALQASLFYGDYAPVLVPAATLSLGIRPKQIIRSRAPR